MNTEHIIRAWRDEGYFESLDAELAVALPESPIGAIDLSDTELAQIDGGDAVAIAADPTLGPLCTATIGVITIIWCWSFINGGTCQTQTIGCC